jgi:hypothetical protein
MSGWSGLKGSVLIAARRHRFTHLGCRLEEITPAGLNTWLSRQRSARAALATASGRQAFAKVELVSESVPGIHGTQYPSPGMPDPRWVAEFVRHLMASGTERWS